MSEVIRVAYSNLDEIEGLTPQIKSTITEAFIAGLEAGYWKEPQILATSDLLTVFLILENEDGSFNPENAVAILDNGTYSAVQYRPST